MRKDIVNEAAYQMYMLGKTVTEAFMVIQEKYRDAGDDEYLGWCLNVAVHREKYPAV